METHGSTIWGRKQTMTQISEETAADAQSLTVSSEQLPDGVLSIGLSGRLDHRTTATAWHQVMAAVAEAAPSTVIVNAAELAYCSSAGFSLLLTVAREQERRGGDFKIVHLKPAFQKSYDAYSSTDYEAIATLKRPRVHPVTRIGQASWAMWVDVRDLVAFVGELCAALVFSLRYPGRIRWREAFSVAETAGVDALPLVSLISFLVGLIMAFQAAIPMRMFGAEIFVANLIALSMLRELGPLMTAIALGGRSGSAFAAELGTMKVNEEIDALLTMGLDPVRFLIVVRVVAAVLVTPLLTLYANLLGLIGGAIVLRTLGYPLKTYFQQAFGAVSYGDLIGGLVKAFVFGILIAGIGCLRGLQTRSGPSAVGVSTTRAVVTSIILIVVADGIFSVVYYYLGI